jgi:hypothetical protein
MQKILRFQLLLIINLLVFLEEIKLQHIYEMLTVNLSQLDYYQSLNHQM